MYNKRRNFINAQSTVVASAYDCSGAGGRKLVRLDNGVLACVMGYASDFYIHVLTSINGGKSWIAAYNINKDPNWAWQTACVAYKNNIYFIGTNNGYICAHSFNVNKNGAVTLLTSTTPDSGQTSYGSGCSITCDKNGTLHAAWCSKNSSYPNSFNIRYSKSTNGGVSWATPTQITITNTSGVDRVSPCIVIQKDSNPLIIHYSTNNYVFCYRYNGTNWNTADITIYYGTTYQQYAPCAVVDNKGIIHVVWYGLDSTDTSQYNVRYSKSLDNGATWSTAVKLTSGNTYPQIYPSISVDGYGNLGVVFIGQLSGLSYHQCRLLCCKSGTWDSVPKTLTWHSGTQTHAQALERCDDIAMPPFIWQDTAASAIKFMADSRIDARRKLLITWEAYSHGVSKAQQPTTRPRRVIPVQYP